MENIENVKKLVSALKSINQDIERKPKCFMTPLQVKATEETLYKISGIKVNINSIRDFKELEEYYQKKLKLLEALKGKGETDEVREQV